MERTSAVSEDNAAKPTKTVRCRLFRGQFNKGWTETHWCSYMIETICEVIWKNFDEK